MILTQTCVKDLEKEETCPYRWMKQWIEKDPSLKLSSEDLSKGKFFEYLVLGSGAIEGEDVKDLPRLRDGSKSTDQLRIEEQAFRIKKALFDKNDPDYLGFEIKSVQRHLSVNDESGTLDIEAIDNKDNIWIIDLKLTKDLSSDRTKYGWGNDWSTIDLIQLTHYKELYNKVYNDVNPRVGLLVADYSPKKQIEFGEILISNFKLNEKRKRFAKAREVIALYEKNEWIKYPSFNECKNCPLTCDKRISETQIIKKTINY